MSHRGRLCRTGGAPPRKACVADRSDEFSKSGQCIVIFSFRVGELDLSIHFPQNRTVPIGGAAGSRSGGRDPQEGIGHIQRLVTR